MTGSVRLAAVPYIDAAAGCTLVFSDRSWYLIARSDSKTMIMRFNIYHNALVLSYRRRQDD